MKSPSESYVDAALRHSQALEAGDSEKANAAFDAKETALKQLRGTADRGREALAALLGHEDPGVRKSAATHLLPLDEDRALGALEEVARLPGLVGFDAEMVIREWNAGRLKVD